MKRRAPDVRVGISGWRYAPWRGVFYPAGLAQKRELAYASGRLRSVEINGSFYSLQRPSSYARWREETPADFVFAVKGGRFLTHNKKLRDRSCGSSHRSCPSTRTGSRRSSPSSRAPPAPPRASRGRTTRG